MWIVGTVKCQIHGDWEKGRTKADEGGVWEFQAGAGDGVKSTEGT